MTLAVLEYHATEPAHVARQLHRALVLLLCPHLADPCPACMTLLKPLVRPLALALFTAATGRKSFKAFRERSYNTISLEQYEAVGRAIDVIEQAAGMAV